MVGHQYNIIVKGRLISEWLLDVFIWTKKTNENISVFLPCLSKIGQIKKRMQIIILEDKWSLISMLMRHYFYDLTHEARAEIQKYFRSFSKRISFKGQLISEWLLDVFIWTKKRTKTFLYFCPSQIIKILAHYYVNIIILLI